MAKISVVTPVYNSERYLERCVEGIINQTFENLEIILVDDGSTDSGPQICDEYAEKDKRIKVIHKKNEGMGVAYNLGIEIATGDYVGFIESDDFAHPRMYEDLYALTENDSIDIVKSAWFNLYQESNYIEKDMQMCDFNSYQSFRVQDCPWILLKQCSVWSAIYKKDFLNKFNIKYLETPGASYQDVGFTYKAFCQSENMIVTPNAYLFYTKDNENSSVNSKEKVNVIFDEYKEVDKFFDDNPNIKIWANTDKLIKQFNDYCWNYNRIAETYRNDFSKQFKEDFQRYINNTELTDRFYESIDGEFLNYIINL